MECIEIRKKNEKLLDQLCGEYFDQKEHLYWS